MGIRRMTGQFTPASSRMRAQLRPAAMVTSTYRSARARRISVRGESIPAIIWGFTPRTMSWQVRAISSLVDGRAPGRVWARAAALAGS